MAPFGQYILKRLPGLRRWAASLALFVLLLYQGASLSRMASLDDLRQLMLLPHAYPTVEAEPHILSDVTIYTPTAGDQCWYDPFPCAPSIDSALELRGEGFTDGFRLRR